MIEKKLRERGVLALIGLGLLFLLLAGWDIIHHATFK